MASFVSDSAVWAPPRHRQEQVRLNASSGALGLSEQPGATWAALGPLKEDRSSDRNPVQA